MSWLTWHTTLLRLKQKGMNNIWTHVERYQQGGWQGPLCDLGQDVGYPDQLQKYEYSAKKSLAHTRNLHNSIMHFSYTLKAKWYNGSSFWLGGHKLFTFRGHTGKFEILDKIPEVNNFPETLDHIPKIMKIPSLDKEFPSQHDDHGFALAIQWFFIESVATVH